MPTLTKKNHALLDKAANAVEFAADMSAGNGGSGTCVIRMTNGQARALATYLDACLARDEDEPAAQE